MVTTITGTIRRISSPFRLAAYNDADAQPATATIPTELGGTTVTPGVYNSAAGTFGITGTVTLNAQGDPAAVFIFQAASTLITASASNVILVNGATAANVFWVVGSSATLGTYSTFTGNIMALASITVTTGVSIQGRDDGDGDASNHPTEQQIKSHHLERTVTSPQPPGDS